MSTDHPNPYLPPAAESELVNPHQLYDGKLLSTARGLRIMYFGFLVILIGLVGVLPVSLFGMAFGALFVSLLPLLGILLVFVGPFFCLTVPPESGLRPAIMWSVFLQILTLLLIVILVVFEDALPNLLAGALGFIVPMIAMGAFVNFLHRLTVCIARPDLTRRVRRVLILGVVTFCSPLLMFLENFVSWGANWDLIIGLASGISVFALSVLLFVAFANLVNAISRAIRRPNESVPGAVF